MRFDSENKFAKWLTAQTNARGELFTLHRAKHYIRNMRISIPLLDLSPPVSIQDLYNCQSVDEFENLRQTFLLASNYKEVNQNASNGAFSAGLSAYGKYMKFIDKNARTSTDMNLDVESFLGGEKLSTIVDRCLIIKTRQSRVDEVGLYYAARYAWCLSENRLDDIDYVLATVNGEIKEVYTNLSWNRVDGGRFEFEGAIANDEIRTKYVGKRIPDEYKKKGMASPCLYTFSNMHNGESRETVVFHLDFVNVDSCSGTFPISCFVNDDDISCGENWRDLLVEITEYCLVHYPNHMERLKTEWLTNYSETPYLLSDKPALAGKEISNGCWINVNHSISQLVRIITVLLRYCGINLRDVNITYTSKNNHKVVNEPRGQALKESSSTVSQKIIEALNEKYANGFRFDTTALRLLSVESDIEISGEIQNFLKRFLFRRNDDVYFLPDIIGDAETRKEIVEFAGEFLDEYGFFEMSELHTLFAENINDKCIYDTDSFESFYLFINKRTVRCVAANGTRIVRVQNENVRTLFSGVADKVLVIIQDKFGGVVREDDLRVHFSAISAELLSSIIGDYIENIVRTEINGIICYQTLETLGLPDDFSETLSELLSRLDELELSPTDEVLHTALSLTLGVNFKSEYNIPNDKTYRRLIAVYYEGAPKREWKYGKFAEVRD